MKNYICFLHAQGEIMQILTDNSVSVILDENDVDAWFMRIFTSHPSG